MFWWLRESAQLKLHRDDQPLEQLFYMSPCQLILPANYADYAAASGKTLTFLRVGEGQSLILRAVPFTPSAQSRAIQVVSIAVPPVDSTTVVELPDTLGALEDQLEVWGSDLSKPLYDSVFEAIAEGVSSSEGVGEGLLILLWVPRTRQGEPERIDILGFLMTSSLFELAKAFDMLGPPDADGRCLRIALVGGQTGTDWRSLEPVPVEVRSALTANMARDLSAVSTENAQFEGVLAGLGALGGALADLWIRQGWGHWTFIDPDRLMPHNLSRHVAFDYDIGQEKVDVMQGHAARIYPDEPLPGAIAKSILSQDADVLNALGQAQLVVDVTTTLHAPRVSAHG